MARSLSLGIIRSTAHTYMMVIIHSTVHKIGMGITFLTDHTLSMGINILLVHAFIMEIITPLVRIANDELHGLDGSLFLPGYQVGLGSLLSQGYLRKEGSLTCHGYHLSLGLAPKSRVSLEGRLAHMSWVPPVARARSQSMNTTSLMARSHVMGIR